MRAQLLFAELLDGLRQEGFSIGMDQCLQMYALFERYPGASPEELKTLLCPIFAVSAAEQERFHRAYGEFFAAPSVPKRTVSRRFTLVSQKLPQLPLPHKTNKKRWLWFAAIAISIAAVVVAVLLLSRRSAVPEQAATPESAPAAVDQPIKPEGPRPTRRPSFLLIAGAFALALFGAEVARTLRRWRRHRKHQAKGRPFDWPVRQPKPTAPRLFADPIFFGAARLMKAREVGEMRRLDVPRSILATIRALGDPVFEYRLDRRVTEYLFLVERRSERDHLAAYVLAMIDALARDGVLVEVFEHDGDPRHCWKPGSSVRIPTVDLYSRFPQHRLIIVGDAVALTNPVTGEALDSIPRQFPWIRRAILTPKAETRALSRFGKYFDVYALVDRGLARLAERWVNPDAPPDKRRTTERRRIVIELPSSPEEIERELDPLLFRWLLRCAVHPTLHWDLTRELAPPLPAAAHATAVLDLARLEWFRQGRIPEPVRLALVSRLAEDEEEEASARAAAMRVLAAAPRPPADSMAARVFEIQQLAHQIWGARDRPAELRPLIRKLRHYPPAQVARDGALMMLLQEAPGTRISHTLPLPLRQLLFRGGIPAFGMKNFVVIAALLPAILFAGNALMPKPEPAPAQPPPIVQQTTAPPPQTTVAETTTSAAVVDTQPVVPESKPELPALPKLIAPADGAVVTIKARRDAVTFTWKPAGAYTLRVLDSKGASVHETKVSGTRATWRATSGSSGNSWMLLTSDGRATDPMAFDVEYAVEESLPIPTQAEASPDASMTRNVEVTLPITCAGTEGKREVDLGLSPRQTFVSAEIKVLNPEAFDTAKVAAYDRASFAYHFIPKKPCRENTVDAKISVTLTLRITMSR